MNFTNEKSNEKLLLFIHDKKRLQNESDDPIKAVVHFSSDESFEPNKMCWFVNSTVTLCHSIGSLVGSVTKNVLLENYKLTVYQISSVTVCVGCNRSSGLAVRLQDLLRSFINFLCFKFCSVEMMIEETKVEVKLNFDLHEVISFIKDFEYISTTSSNFLKTKLLLEHVLTINSDFGCVLMKDGKVLNSTFPIELTILVAIFKNTSSFDSVTSSLNAFLSKKWFDLYYGLYLNRTRLRRKSTKSTPATLSSTEIKPDSDAVSVSIVSITKKNYSIIILRNTFQTSDGTDEKIEQIKKYFNLYIENNFY